MKNTRFTVLLIVTALFSSCSGNSWFGGTKKLDMPGERVSVSAKSKDLAIMDKNNVVQFTGSPQVNHQWNGWYNQFNSKTANLHWDEKSLVKSIAYSTSTSLIQPALPVIDGNAIFVISSDDGSISAYDTTNQQRLWKNDFFCNELSGGMFTLQNDKFFSGGMYKDGSTLYASIGLSKVVAINSNDGQTLWNAEFNSPVRSIPLVVGDAVIFQSIDNKVFALNRKNGANIWSYSSTNDDVSMLTSPSLLAMNNMIIVKFTNDEIVALDKKNGEELWSNNLFNKQEFGLVNRTGFNVSNAFFVEDNHIITINSDGYVFKIDALSGNTMWSKNLGATGKGWLNNKIFYFISSNNDLIAYNTATISPIWLQSLNIKDSDGKSIPDLYWSNPVIANNYIYIASNNGKLMKISPKDGSVAQETAISSDVYLGPIFAGGSMYIITNSGNLDKY